jgi:SH3-like domain-containing protein
VIGKPALRLLWWITALVTISLIVVTIGLVSVFLSQRDLGQVAYIKADVASVSIRSNPNATSRVVSILEGGTQVYIVQNIESRGTLWAQVRRGETVGWLPYANLSQYQQNQEN